jgi:hypothetical protein
MKRIWIFVPDIFLALLIVMSCERMSFDQGEVVEAERELWVFSDQSPPQENPWDKHFAVYKGKAKEFLEKLNLDL